MVPIWSKKTTVPIASHGAMNFTKYTKDFIQACVPFGLLASDAIKVLRREFKFYAEPLILDYLATLPQPQTLPVDWSITDPDMNDLWIKVKYAPPRFQHDLYIPYV